MSKGIVMIGAGGHAKVCIELLRDMGEVVDICIGAGGVETECLGIPIVVGDENLGRLWTEGYRRAFIALGANHLRSRLGLAASEMGYEIVNAISSFARVSLSAKLGKGVAIMAGAVINAEAAIADFAIINTGATVDHDCSIGHAAHVAPQCALAGNVKVDDFSFLGIGTKVIPGIHIGAAVIVGAGSVVVKDLEPSVTALGVPARVIKQQPY